MMTGLRNQTTQLMPYFFRIPHWVVALAASVMFSQVAAAEYLEVSFRDGTTVGFDLNDRPVVSLGESLMTIKSGTVEAEYKSDTVRTFAIRESTGVSEAVRQGEIRIIYRERDHVSVAGLDCGVTVFLYSANGRMMASAVADDAGDISFNLESYPKGAYIISTNNGQSFKIIR